MKKIILLTAALLLTTVGFAQIKKGDVTLGVSLGYNSYIGQQDPGYKSTYDLSAQNTTGFTNPLSVGFEGSWFVTNNWAVRFGGGFGYTYKPGYKDVPGTIVGDGTDSWEDGGVPNYRAVGSATDMRWNAMVGMAHYWQMKQVPNLYFYTGFQLGFSYSLFQIKYDEESSMGKALSQTYSGRVSWSCGVDYYVAKSLYIGAEVQPVQYSYSVSGIRPQAGMSLMQADSHNFGFLAMPTIKIGFKF